jgi:hypothetical protein
MHFIKVFETNFISLHLPGVLRESLRLVRGQEALVLFGGGIDWDSENLPRSQSHKSHHSRTGRMGVATAHGSAWLCMALHGSAWLCQVNRGCDPFDCQDRDRATELQLSERFWGHGTPFLSSTNDGEVFRGNGPIYNTHYLSGCQFQAAILERFYEATSQFAVFCAEWPVQPTNLLGFWL